MYSDRFNEIVYEVLSDIVGLKFKQQIKNSGIELEGIFEKKNLIDGTINYVIYLDEKVLVFKDKRDFIVEFHNYIVNSLKELQQEEIDIVENESDYMVLGENLIYYRKEEIGSFISKQYKLLKKLKEFHTQLKSEE